jgi:hypothetical protein
MGGKLAAATLAVVAAATGGRATAEPTEAELKAEFVERFTRFVDWGDGDLPDDSFTVCVAGESSVTPFLQKIAKKRKLHDRDATVVVIDKPDQIEDCQVVLIPGTSKKRLRTVLRRTDGRPILTVAESTGAAEAGAIINFYRDESHVKFEINTTAAKDAGLKVRAKLLRLARVVHEGSD